MSSFLMLLLSANGTPIITIQQFFGYSSPGPTVTSTSYKRISTCSVVRSIKPTNSDHCRSHAFYLDYQWSIALLVLVDCHVLANRQFFEIDGYQIVVVITFLLNTTLSDIFCCLFCYFWLLVASSRPWITIRANVNLMVTKQKSRSSMKQYFKYRFGLGVEKLFN